MRGRFIFEHAPFAAAHASTVAETGDGLVAAWFAGTREGHRDVGIWISRYKAGGWQPPEEIANGFESRWRRYPCWNPVLFQVPEGPLLLFYKAGRRPSRWWGMVTRSEDGGQSWAQPRRLPNDILGPIKNKPILLDDGTLLCPSSSEDAGWRVHVERTRGPDGPWARSGPLNRRDEFKAIQPAALKYPDGRLQLLCRSRQGVIAECWSKDSGESWSKMAATRLPNPDSGIDAVTLSDGRALLIYNHSSRGRSPLNLALSRDGVQWQAAAVVENAVGEFSYPAIIQAADGTVHITYSWNRSHIKHLALDPNDLDPKDMPDAVWPA